MPSPGDIGTAVSGMAANLLPTIMKWVGIGLISAIILGVIYAIFIMMQYKYAVTIYVMGKMGDKHYIRDIKTARGRINREKGVDKLQLFMSRVSIKPNFDFIYPRNRINLFQVGRDNFLHGRVQFSENPGAFVTPVEEDVNFWAHVQSQQIIRDYQEQTFMSKYGTMMFMLIGGIVFLVMAAVVVWMTYKYIGGELGAATNAAKSLSDSWSQGMAQKFAPN